MVTERRNHALRWTTSFVAVLLLSAGCTGTPEDAATASSQQAVSQQAEQQLIIRCSTRCGDMVAAIEAMGGTVTEQYDNVDAIAATVRADRVGDVAVLAGDNRVTKDQMVGAPVPVESFALREATHALSSAELAAALGELPAGYPFGNVFTGAATLHGDGITGDGVIVAIIDSGTANNASVVTSLAGAVIGGENFVPGAAEPSATSTLNGAHGTWVGSTVASDVGFLFANGSTFVRSLLMHDPSSVVFDIVPGLSLVTLTGTAPNASLYALKVFPAAGGGSPESRVIAAMDRAITQRRNYNQGMPSVPVAGDGSEDNPFVFDSLNIQVVNMSLGGSTLFAGRDLEDQLSLEMLNVGITLIASAGNSGHAAMTGGSPGTGMGSLTSGAVSTVVHERVLRDLQYGLGVGALYRPADHHQMATFSSRGPTADGRLDPDASAPGFAILAQGPNGRLRFVSGTSFSAPITAGAAALLRENFPAASATTIRNALIETANPAALGDAGLIDQGAGVIDVAAARDALAAGTVSEYIDRGQGQESVSENVEGAGLVVQACEGFSTHVAGLLPGQVEHTFIEVAENIDSITITIENITPELPPSQQNLFFGDDVLFKVLDAPTSNDNDPFGSLYLSADTTLVFDNPQTGVIRLATMGDWTNAGRVSVDLSFQCHEGPVGDDTAEGEVAQRETDVVFVDIPSGTSEAMFELAWDQNWGRYPTDDLDMILIDPDGNANYAGAAFSSPERVEISTPTAGIWQIEVVGFTVHNDDEDEDSSEYEIRVDADGVRLE